MSGSTIVSESPAQSNMIAMSFAPAAPHLLSRLDPISTLPILEHLPDRLSMSSMSSKRPKLSLKTSDLAPTYVGSTTSRNDANAHNTATPTTLNTFNNTFDLTYRPSPVSAIPSPGPTISRRPTNLQPLPYTLNLPFGVYSILKNSPLLRDVRRPSLATTSASPRISGRRMFFPAPKKVTFKPVLEEEIVTKDYVARHADLTSSSDDDTASSESESSLRNSDDPGEEVKGRIIRVDEFSSRGRSKRKTRATSDSGVTEERGRQDRSRSTSERRTKRKKARWEWTLTSTPMKADDSPAIKETEQTGEENVDS